MAPLPPGPACLRAQLPGPQVERDLELIGVTAIEDKLQDGVPAAIQTLLDAGVKVCVNRIPPQGLATGHWQPLNPQQLYAGACRCG